MKPRLDKNLPDEIVEIGKIRVSNKLYPVFLNYKKIHLNKRYYCCKDNKWFILEDFEIDKIRFDLKSKLGGVSKDEKKDSKYWTTEAIRQKLGLKY